MYKQISVMAVATVLALSSAAQAQSCLTQSERAAMAMRHIQTQLMVGALACRGSDDMGQRRLYTGFVLGNRQSLGRHGRALQAYFARLYGSDAQTRLDRHVTGVANRISRDANRQDDFCSRIAAFGRTVLSSDLNARTVLDLSASAPVGFKSVQPDCDTGTMASITE